MGRPVRRGTSQRLVRRCVWLLLVVAGSSAADSTCSVDTPGVAFGTYDIVVPTPTDAVGAIDLICSFVPTPGGPPPSVAVYLNAGTSGVLSDRRMFSATDSLRYNLYTNVARTQIWGDGTAGTAFHSARITVGPGVGNSVRSVQFSIYGRIPAQQSVDSGSYSDTIVVTVEF